MLSGYGREMELEADDLGAQYIYQDGYSPQGMYDVLAVLKDQEIYSKKVVNRENPTELSWGFRFTSLK